MKYVCVNVQVCAHWKEGEEDRERERERERDEKQLDLKERNIIIDEVNVLVGGIGHHSRRERGEGEKERMIKKK